MKGPVLKTIAGIVGANLALDFFRALREEQMPKLHELGPGTNLYAFTPSHGGGRALIHVDGRSASVRKMVGNARQTARIKHELELLFDGVQLDLLDAA